MYRGGFYGDVCFVVSLDGTRGRQDRRHGGARRGFRRPRREGRGAGEADVLARGRLRRPVDLRGARRADGGGADGQAREARQRADALAAGVRLGGNEAGAGESEIIARGAVLLITRS